MNILEALSALDTDNDDDWTKDGLPKTEAVSEVVGETVTRAQITEVAPQFSRTNSVLEVADATPDAPADPGTDPDEASDDQTSTDEGDDTGDDAADDDASNDDDDQDDEDEDDQDDEPEVLAGRLGKAHPEVVETAKELDDAAKAVKEAQTRFKAATVAHSKAVDKHSPLTHTAEENQRGIMDHIAAGMKRKEKKFEDAKATQAALHSITNPIDRANAKPEHRGFGNLHNHAPAGKTE